MKTMKRSMLLLSAVLAMASTAALAEDAALEKAGVATSKAVKLTDAELDNVTAGSGLVATGIFNPGNASIFRLTDSRIQCVNCSDVTLPGTVNIVVLNPGHPTGFFRCAGPGCL
jgi:hypothetical protein